MPRSRHFPKGVSSLRGENLRKETERLFYRAAEIRRRAKRVNELIRPDVVICLHFNAEPWGDATNPQLVDQNHLHFLIAGALERKGTFVRGSAF